jgi:hypothetical protein
VWGRATDATLDHDLQVIDPLWSGPALKTWLSTGGNVRMSHDSRRPIGKGISAQTDNEGATWVKSVIVDDQAQNFIRKGVLQAYSVGISRPVVREDPTGYAKNGVICGGVISEVTICDRGSNPSCGVTICKAAKDGSAVFVGKTFGDPEKAARKAAKAQKKAFKAFMVSALGSADPAERETASEWLAKNA